MKYCCYVRNVLAEMGIRSEERWYEAKSIVEAAMAYYMDVGTFPTDITSENPDQKERSSFAHFYVPNAALEAELEKTKRSLQLAEESRDQIEKQRDNFLEQRDRAIEQNEALFALVNHQVNNVFHAAKTALIEVGKVVRKGEVNAD